VGPNVNPINLKIRYTKKYIEYVKISFLVDDILGEESCWNQ
jgi:hypothetical protein